MLYNITIVGVIEEKYEKSVSTDGLWENSDSNIKKL
jgi:hypothetical protein